MKPSTRAALIHPGAIVLLTFISFRGTNDPKADARGDMRREAGSSKTESRSKPVLNPRNQPIPQGEDAALFELTNDSDSTPGSNNFMRLLNRAGIKFEQIKRDAKPTADFIIEIGDLRIVAEVTDIEPNPQDEALEAEAIDKGVCFPEPIGPLTTRSKIVRKCSKKQSQFEKPEYAELPKILVILNGCAQPYLRHIFVSHCLYGAVKDQKAVFLDDRQRSISAIACLDNGLDQDKANSYMGEAKMRLYLNPLAHVPLSLGCFLGIDNITCFWLDKSTNEIASNCKDMFQLFTGTA